MAQGVSCFMMIPLPEFLPLPKAARKLGISEAELQARIESGTITAGKLPDGEIVVSVSNQNRPPNGGGEGKVQDINDRLRAIKREDFEHLRGNPITVTDAAEKYGIPRNTVLEWTKKVPS